MNYPVNTVKTIFMADYHSLLDSKEKFVLLELTKNNETPKTDCYEQYTQIHISNLILSNEIKELQEEKTQLKAQLSLMRSTSSAAKRTRRKACEIPRFYVCACCNKQYGSEASLKHHLKLKHPQLTS